MSAQMGIGAKRKLDPELGELREIGKLSRNKAGKTSWGQHRWHALGANPFPETRAQFEGDLGEVMRTAVSPGSLPAAPMLTPTDELVTVGSCFARTLRDRLITAGVESRSVWIPDGLSNTFAIVDCISWCVTGSQTSRGFSYERTADGAIRKWKPPTTPRETFVDAFRAAGGFVFTLGLAEVWEDKETGAVFWQGVPEDIFDDNRHVFRLSTVAENEANLLKVVELIRSVNADAPIVFTLSPIPLKATFRDVSCVVADCVSKSVLRVAIDLVMARQLSGVYYWPSFEMVRWVGAHRPQASFGYQDDADLSPRVVVPEVVDAIIEAFLEAFYIEPPGVAPSAHEGRPPAAARSDAQA